MIRKLELSDDLDAVAALTYDTDEYLFPFIFGARKKALPVLKKLLQREHNSFSHRYVWCDIEADELRAILIGYDHRTIDAKRESADFEAVLPLIDRVTMVFKNLALRPILNKSDVTGTYVQNLCVAAAHRGKGLGSGLIRHFCRLQPVDVFLDVESGNTQALALYERLGFKTISKKAGLFKGLGNYRMVRPLTHS